MIIGIGTDIVQIQRIEKILLKYGQLFTSKILHEEEIKNLAMLPVSEHASYISKRFAAKEAISKALGTGIGYLGYKDIAILNDKKGRPVAKVNNKKKKKIGDFKIDISLSDDYPIAIAFSVVSV